LPLVFEAEWQGAPPRPERPVKDSFMALLESEVPEISPKEIAAVFFRRFRQMLIVYATIVIVASAYCFFWPPTYEAGARFLVKHDRAEPILTSEQGDVRMLSRQMVTEDDLNSEMAILQSPAVIEKTVRDTNMTGLREHWLIRLMNAPIAAISDVYNQYHGKAGASAFTRAADRLNRKLDVSPQKKSAILEAHVRWGDPEYAKFLLETITKNYMAHHVEVHRVPDTQSFFLQQAESKKEALEAVERQIEAIRPGATLGGATFEKELWLKQSSDFEAEWRKARALGLQAQARVKSSGAELETQPPRITTEERPLVNQLAIGTLEGRLLELRLKRTDLLTKFQPTNPLVIEVEEELKQASDMLAAETQQAASQKTTDVNKVAQTLQEDLALDRTGLKSTAALEMAMRREYEDYKSRLSTYNSQSRMLHELDRQQRSLETSMLQYQQQYESARVEDAMNNTRMLNVTMLEPVWVDPVPVKPNSMWILKLALGVGLVLSIGWGFLLERLDHRVKSTRDLETYLKAPVLATFDLYRDNELASRGAE
jgi:uncharacterized protein involved in exopolysaccharide biosynthesis